MFREELEKLLKQSSILFRSLTSHLLYSKKQIYKL